jgi:predicted transport protein
MSKTPHDAEAAMVANLKENTGKSIDQWTKLASASGFAKHGEVVTFLKEVHKLGHGYANLIAHRTFKSGASDAAPDDLITSQYAGTKAGLKPIYDAIITAMTRFGSDVEVSPKKAYVSVRRAKQFAILQPSTAARLDVGVNLKGAPPTPRLEASGSFNSMVSHRVRIEAAKDIDQQLIGWLKQAYDAAG